jgi:hypothetical protein
MTGEKRNVSITFDEYAIIYQHKQANPKITYPELAAWAQSRFGLIKKPDPTTISKGLAKAKENGFTDVGSEGKRKRLSKPRYPVRI